MKVICWRYQLRVRCEKLLGTEGSAASELIETIVVSENLMFRRSWNYAAENVIGNENASATPK